MPAIRLPTADWLAEFVEYGDSLVLESMGMRDVNRLAAPSNYEQVDAR